MIRKLAGYGLIINGRFLQRRVSGVERYAYEIYRRLPSSLRVEIPPNASRELRGHLWEQLILPLLTRGSLLWSPANSGPLAVANQVVTLCDTSVIDHPDWFSPRFAAWYQFLLPRLAHRACRIFTPSEFSRLRLIQSFHLPPAKVTVIYPGVDHARFHPLPEPVVNNLKRQLSLPDRYLLFVGTLEPRKNLPRLLLAWDHVRPHFPGTGLVIAGATAGPAFAAQDLPGSAQGVLFLGYVAEDHLAALYSGALAFILPSLSEGFGLPVLESMACGTPVLAADAGALPEVVAGASLLFDPLDVNAIAQAISQAISEPALRSELRRRGLTRALQFSWESSAAAAWFELEKILSSTPRFPVDHPSPVSNL